MAVLTAVTIRAHIGTNLGLLHILWALVSGQLLSSRGGLLPALKSSGLSDHEVRHAWSASRYGAWQVNNLIGAHVEWVKRETTWQTHEHGGYRALAADMVGFFRPKLKSCLTKHYHPAAGRAIPAIELGMIAEVGHIGTQRIPLLTQVIRMPEGHTDHKALREAVVRKVRTLQAQDQVAIVDAEFGAGELLRFGTGLFVARGDKNATFRRVERPVQVSLLRDSLTPSFS